MKDRGASGEITRAVGAVVRRHLPEDVAGSIVSDATLTDLGLGSLAVAELIVDLEQTFGVEFPEHMVVPETFRSVETIAAAVQALRASQASSPG